MLYAYSLYRQSESGNEGRGEPQVIQPKHFPFFNTEIPTSASASKSPMRILPISRGSTLLRKNIFVSKRAPAPSRPSESMITNYMFACWNTHCSRKILSFFPENNQKRYFYNCIFFGIGRHRTSFINCRLGRHS